MTSAGQARSVAAFEQGPSALHHSGLEGAAMNIRSLQQGLKYRARVDGVRQTYHVFEGRDYYFVLSFARAKSKAGGGYFNVIKADAVDYVQSRFGGRSGVTAQDVAASARRTRHVPTSLYALNILYVLVALGDATILRQGERRQLLFRVRTARARKPDLLAA
jgi:hypothetical protein